MTNKLELINYKRAQRGFPPKIEKMSTSQMLQMIAQEEPAYAFVISWPRNQDLPTLHTSTDDGEVLTMRLEEFLKALKNNEYDNLIGLHHDK